MAGRNDDAVLALCPPDYMSTRVPNNQWMRDTPAKQRSVDLKKAHNQFMDLYSLLTADALVYLIPPQPGLQDQVYATNAGTVLPHMGHKTFLLSNWYAKAREGEELEAQQLLEKLGFLCTRVPFFFEGEAELKWLHDDIYLGGYGQRTSLKALQWISETFHCRVIPIEEKDPYLYHLDCSIFPLSGDVVLAYTAGMTKETVKELESVATIIPITKPQAYGGVTNSLRIGYTVYTASCISELPSANPAFPSLKEEREKNRFLEEVCRSYGLELVFVNLSEMLKSGALLSCCVLHLSYDSVGLCKP
jgi:N-dimethylarginine dimethylaminohydrolase